MAEIVRFGPLANERGDDLEGVDYDKWLRDPPPRDWMVEGCFLKGHVGLISGIGGVGKSLLMQQLATCATMGLPWLGIPLKRGRALMLACEDDDDELHRRQRDINRSLGLDMGDVLEAGLDVIARDDRENLLMELDRPADEALLRKIPGVQTVTARSGNCWLLQPKEGTDIRAAVFQFAVQHKLTLLGMQQQAHSLEEVFRELTQPAA